MKNIDQKEFDRIPTILNAIEPMCSWELPEEECNKKVLFCRNQFAIFFSKYYSNWLNVNIIHSPSCMRKIIKMNQIPKQKNNKV